MKFIAGETYHLYNRGNNRQPIFFHRSNYVYFIRKMRESLLGNCDILSYCLMPNHYHILLRPTEQACQILTFENDKTTTTQQVLTRKIGHLQSSYTRALQKQEGFKGSLFQQKSKAKLLRTNTGINNHHVAICMHYIHQNPLKAGLVNKLEDWEYSSFPDYAGLRNGTLCNKEMGLCLADLSTESFIKDSYAVVDDKFVQRILY